LLQLQILLFITFSIMLENTTNLYSKIKDLLINSKNQIRSQVNTTIINTYFEMGKMIVEEEQKGNIKAEYGKSILKNLSVKLTEEFGKGFSLRNLEQIRLFYIVFGNTQTLSAKLSWSHYVRLLSFNSNDQKLQFYITETELNNWSLSELNRQIDSALFERIGLSSSKEELMEDSLDKYHTPHEPTDIIKDPYVLEFLGLEESTKYSEKQFEAAIIDNLQKFLLEMGKGFTFVARQKRLTFEDKHYYADIVLYNRILKCFVIIDLKIDKLTHQDVGQMEMYVNFYDMEKRLEGENPTIGLILVPEKDNAIIKYVVNMKSRIFAKEYQVIMPNQIELQKVINNAKSQIITNEF
jgi:predicted nuclease of restriction endonuclease-like (RecB) superfamily